MDKEPLTQENHLDVINFTNIDSEDFVCSWGSKDVQIGIDAGGKPEYKKVPVEYFIKAGETKQFPRFLAYHFVKHLIDKICLRKYGNQDAPGREELEAKILGMTVAPESYSPKEVEEDIFSEVPKDEELLKCEKCDKTFKNKIGLSGHSRSHR